MVIQARIPDQLCLLAFCLGCVAAFSAIAAVITGQYLIATGLLFAAVVLWVAADVADIAISFWKV